MVSRLSIALALIILTIWLVILSLVVFEPEPRQPVIVMINVSATDYQDYLREHGAFFPACSEIQHLALPPEAQAERALPCWIEASAE